MGANISPQNLSERSVIAGVGLASPTWRGLMAWFEAGEALRYQIPRGETGSALPDYRGGISYTSAVRGPHGCSRKPTTTAFSSAVSTTTVCSIRRTAPAGASAKTFRSTGTGTPPSTPRANIGPTPSRPVPACVSGVSPLLFTVNFLRGAYLVNQSNPYRPNFNDVRIGVWYAFTRISTSLASDFAPVALSCGCFGCAAGARPSPSTSPATIPAAGPRFFRPSACRARRLRATSK